MSDPTKNKNSKKHTNKLGYIDPTVAGIDIGDKLIHVSIPNDAGGVYVKEFGTTTPELKRIVAELKKANVKTGVMEATGVYWIPLYEIMEESDLTPVLVDAKSVKNPPGRKSDVVDAQWIQTLYSSGLLRAAYRPPQERLTLRAYVRQRMNIIKTSQRSLLHMEKAMQLMNVKLSTAVSDIAGISGFNIMRAIVAGERNPKKLAALRSTLCRKDEQVFIDALTGNFQEEHIFSLKLALDQYDFSHKQLEECDKRILDELERLPDVVSTPLPECYKDKKKKPKFSALKKPKKNAVSFDIRGILWRKTGIDMTSLTGIAENTALVIFSELGGTDVSAWNNDKAFSSWLKLSPGNNISGGKRRKSKRQKPSANYISQALRMSAVAASRSDTSLGAHIRRICGRADKARGIKAGAHKLAIRLYHMCKYGWVHFEMGAEENERIHAQRTLAGLEKRAKNLGYKLVPLKKAA